jgi:hypothetical protein
MIENNKLEKSFGPVGTSAGSILFIAGLVLILYHLTGLILVVIGAFVGFSSTSALIDYERKRARFSNNLFGIIKTGRWLSIEPGMKIGIKKSNLTWRAYSGGNRALDLVDTDYRITLFDSGNKEIMQLKKTKSKETAITEREAMGNKLGLSSI